MAIGLKVPGRLSRTGSSGAGEGAPELGRSATAAAPKLRRRPLMVAASILAIALGAIVAGWLWTSTSGASPVAAMRASVARGEVIERADLMTVQVVLDPALQVLSPGEAQHLVGKRAVVDLSAGSLITKAALETAVVPAAGRSVVGVAAGPEALPGEPLLVGDRVQVVVAASQAAAAAGTGKPWSVLAQVVGVRPTGLPGQAVQIVSVDVPQASALELAGKLAGGGRVQIILESRER